MPSAARRLPRRRGYAVSVHEEVWNWLESSYFMFMTLSSSFPILLLRAALVPFAASDPPTEGIVPIVLLEEASLRIPSPAYLAPGDTITGTAQASVRDSNGALRRARPEEITATVLAGDLKVPVRAGRFILENLAPGRTTVRLFTGDGIGAELTRITLIVPDTAGAVVASARRPGAGYLSQPMMTLGSNLIVTGPFSGAGDDPELRVGEIPATLLWEAPAGCLFDVPGSDQLRPGPLPMELRRSGRKAASGEIALTVVKFTPPHPAVVSERGERIVVGAEVYGLPRPAADEPKYEGLVELMFRNLTPKIVTDLRSKSPRARRENEDLIVPILPEMISPDGVASVQIRAKGKSPGEFRIEGSLVVPPRQMAARKPLGS